MKKSPIVFSLVRDQSVFMTVIMSLLTFLAVLALGIVLSIGTGVIRWNARWDMFATVQVTDSENADGVRKIIAENAGAMKSSREISDDEMTDLMRPWVSGGGSVMKNYLPKMWEIEFKSDADMKKVRETIGDKAKFLRHASALKASTSAGWKMMAIATLLLAVTLGAIGACISFIARNTAMLHRRELEILNQIGASDGFVAHQMQRIVGKISMTAGLVGFLAAAPILMLILSTAHSARVGLMAMLGLTGWGWTALVLMPIVIVMVAIQITKKTTLNILKSEK